jgi:hypothetical protein
VFDALLRFDTSSLPDNATVTSAVLRVFVTAKQNADARSLVADWYDASSWPIDAADWVLDPAGSALAGAPVSGIAVGAQNDFSFAGLGSVSLTGPTGLRLQLGGGQPAGDNYVQMASFDNPSNPRPQLIVTYTAP